MTSSIAIELQNLAPPTNHNTPLQGHEPFPFLHLPIEMQLEVLSHALISNKSIRWVGSFTSSPTSSTTSSARQVNVCNGKCNYMPPHYNIASPLIVSKSLYTLATGVFYGNNTFTFTSLTTDLPLAFTNKTFIENLRHLSIGNAESRLSNISRRIARTDGTNSMRLEEITRLCPGLVSFVNHVPEVVEEPVVQGALGPPGLRVRVVLWMLRSQCCAYFALVMFVFGILAFIASCISWILVFV